MQREQGGEATLGNGFNNTTSCRIYFGISQIFTLTSL